MTPITPAEAQARRHSSIPGYVFQIVNDLLVANLRGGIATITQREIAAAIHSHPEYISLGIPHPNIFQRGWMDFEDHYREHGWEVTYNRPVLGDMSPPSYTFKS